MKAVVYRGASDLRLEEVETPVPERGEILVRVEASGICGTDLKKIQKGRLSAPRVFGHEIAGTVAGVGAGVERFREGDRVVVHHHVPCRSCFYCRHRAYAQCETYKKNGTTAGFEPSGGGYSQFVKALPWIVEQGVIPVPDGVAAEEATFVEPVNTCLKAVRRAGIEKGQTVLVVGQGPIGLLLLQLARWAGADVLTSDTVPERLRMSRELGAAAALDAGLDVPREVRGATEGR
ncbi:MAG TPA: alcohol dehydrogenase catalytic domain-containing protein, partial [Vicinamibacteria bacterium]